MVEDNLRVSEEISLVLEHAGWRVRCVPDGKSFRHAVAELAPTLVVLDLNLPGEDGFSLSRRIRQVHPLVGIIIISARSDLQDKIIGYDSGADWYLPKPVPFGELSAALKSFARRRQAQQFETVTSAGSLRLQQRELQGPAGSVRLTPAEETLLTAFARAPSGRLENWQLLEQQGQDSIDASKTSLEVRITRLRKKLAQAGAEGHCLESIRGIGYQLHVPVQVIA
jgi:DNA-binding response OmpR family regulator